MVSCPQCKANVTGQFCSQCGARVHSKCGSCNAMVKAGSRFCSQCGKPVGGASAPASAPSKATRPAQAVPSKSTTSRAAPAKPASSAPAKPASSAPARRGFASARGAPQGGGAARKWGSPKAKLDVSVDTARRVDALDVDASSVGRSNIAIKKTHRSPAVRAAPAAPSSGASSASRPAPSPSSSASTTAQASTPTPAPSAASKPIPTVVTERPTVSASTPVISTSAASSSLAVPSKKKKKRHSKILISDGGDDRTAALDVVGLEQNKPKKKGVGNMWAQRMQEQQNEAFQKNRDKLRSRRRGGVEFMDQQIRNLITEMKRLNENCGTGMASVKYGTLFRETIDSMPALSATLTCAKKRSVVTYEGGMLMQGTSDNVVISLIKDEIEDSGDFKSVFGAAPIKFDNEKRGPEKCEFCNKTVYPTERVHANGKTMHKQCFRCCECQTVLKLAAFAFNGGKFYCETHFQQMFKKGSGYNF